jgi:hypothetical protein
MLLLRLMPLLLASATDLFSRSLVVNVAVLRIFFPPPTAVSLEVTSRNVA